MRRAAHLPTDRPLLVIRPKPLLPTLLARHRVPHDVRHHWWTLSALSTSRQTGQIRCAHNFPKMSGKSSLAKAIPYASGPTAKVRPHLVNSSVELDGNTIEFPSITTERPQRTGTMTICTTPSKDNHGRQQSFGNALPQV